MTVPGAWRVVDSATLVKDRWIDLRADHCVTPSGQELNPYYVLRYPDWVHVVALTRGGQLVLVRQYRHGAGEAVLELPGGAVDAAEPDPEEAARRELLEETGYTAGRWLAVSSLFPNPATQTNRLHVFVALDAEATGAQELDPGEDGLAVELMEVRAVLAGLAGGLIGQAMHVSALLLGLHAAGRLAWQPVQPPLQEEAAAAPRVVTEGAE